MDIKKTLQGTVAAGILGTSFITGGQLTETRLNAQHAVELKQTFAWTEDQVNVFNQQQAVIRRQREILDKWDSCELCKEKCSVTP